MKRKIKRRVKKGRVVLLFIILVLIVFVVFNLFNKDDNKKVEKKKENKVVEKTKSSSLSMIMVGDNIVHEAVFKDANKNAGGSGYDFKPMYKLVKPIVSKYDLAYVNQETVLGGSSLGISGYPTFNSPYEIGDALVDTGFNLVSLATNHIMDSGTKAVYNSIDYWNLQKDVLTSGSYSSNEERNKAQIKEKNNIKYTMLNYSYGSNSKVPNDQNYLVNIWPMSDKASYESYKEQVKKDISAVRDKVDVLIVAMHWGVEYTEDPTTFQKDAAQFLADNGVDIVIGTHPHIIEPVTWIDDTIVFYSLGNFLSSQYQDDNYNKVVGLMSSLTITKEEKNNEVKITIDNVNNELVYNYYTKNRDGLLLIPFSNKEIKNKLPNYKEVYNKYKNVVQKIDSNIPVVESY